MPKIALIGRPNVGKSTLFNRLTRSKSALVAPMPGLTRDRHYGRFTAACGMTMEVIDTGGLAFPSGRDSEMETLVLKQGLKAIDEADIILFILDAKEGLTGSDKDIAEMLRVSQKPVIIAVNKMDDPAQEAALGEFYELGMAEINPISAEHGWNISELTDKLAKSAMSLGFGKPEERLGSYAELTTWTESNPVAESRPQAHIDAPIKVAIIGRPNVGKSSLLNRLLGEPRMIVSNLAGTTRDAIDTLLKRNGDRDILFTDTAGIRRKAKIDDKIEKFSVIKAIEALKTCDTAVVVLDATEGITDQDKRLIGYIEEYKRAVVTVFNKWDLIQGDKLLVRLRTEELESAKRFISYAPHVNLSALTGRNVNKLLAVIDSVYKEFTASVGTGKANQALQKAMALKTPPIIKGHFLKLYYTTQVATAPPTFLVFANYPELIPNYYLRFMLNQFRKQLGLIHTPIHFIFKERERRK
ncbi:MULTISPECIES: ribosome biogenesis GTPase Der [Dissulfurimicrobium]|uniref:ribosome biogenesis GTPase Der n=1 Tax=Dissulfurimicrobium TaxID=1769732 RepID=UPI001EDC61B6|nr:ribosome biogenesis GTPase Der [Dissulfurimicrobium hydrothermale]UKL13661.1 ribosome biogenesis GTPase Der [Dissulfurimicrobium hydrothermale]